MMQGAKLVFKHLEPGTPESLTIWAGLGCQREHGGVPPQSFPKVLDHQSKKKHGTSKPPLFLTEFVKKFALFF